MKIKTKKIMLALLLALGLSARAQNFNFGILAGFDIVNATVTNEPKGNNSKLFYPMISFNANGYVSFKSTGFWGLSMEPGFIQKGGLQKGSDDDIRFQLNYIQLPILANFYFSNKLSITIGPEFSYMINAKAKSKSSSSNITDWYDKRFELSGLVGINYQLTDKFDIGLRYNHGLTYTTKIIFTDALGNQSGDSKEYNQYYQLIVKIKI